jgi:choline dehydrogenase-like flavoprotein
MAKEHLRVEVVVVGTGPGGATVARELARAGRSVLMLERGRNERNSRLYGTYLGALRYLERHGLFFTPEGVQVVIPSMVGGATGVFAGCAAPPPPWLHERYGIDIRAEVEETIQELGIAPLPPELRGTASTQLAQAAQSLGYEVYPSPSLCAQSERNDSTAAPTACWDVAVGQSGTPPHLWQMRSRRARSCSRKPLWSAC